MGTNEFGGDENPLVKRFELCGNGEAIALAVELLRAELAADRGDTEIGIVGEPVSSRAAEIAAVGVGGRQGHRIAIGRQRVAADLHTIFVRRIHENAVTRLVVGYLQTVCARLDPRE